MKVEILLVAISRCWNNPGNTCDRQTLWKKQPYIARVTLKKEPSEAKRRALGACCFYLNSELIGALF
jgi:hypothetical protein